MKKLLLATTVIAASVSAMAQTTVYGNLNQVLTRTTTGGVSETGIVSDQSRIGVKATESLGGALKVTATIETDVGAQTVLGNRTATVGLSNQFGSISGGTADTGSYAVLTSVDPFAASYGSILGDVHNTGSKKLTDAVFVTTAPIMGVTFTFDRGSNAAQSPYSLTASTKVVGVDVSAAYFDQGASNTKLVAAATDIGSFGTRVSASYSRNDVAGLITQGSLIGVAQKLSNTPVTVKASYGAASGEVVAYNLGASYALSKKTSIDAVYRKLDSAVDVSQYGIGLNHAF